MEKLAEFPFGCIEHSLSFLGGRILPPSATPLTWIFTIILYTLLARKYGAAEKYPEEEEAERKKMQPLRSIKPSRRSRKGSRWEDHSVLSKVLRGIALASLVITLVLAARVMFWSPEASVYEANRDIFYRYGFVCTIVYFVFAYWALRRRLALNK